MAVILNIETATRVCSVGVSIDGKLIALRESHTQNSHAEQITLFVQEVLNKSSITTKELDAVAVSKGPGSYTGLRIGVSTAKGFCYGLDIPLIGINTLESMANGMINLINKSDNLATKNVLVCPMIDARRMEVYSSVFSMSLNVIEETMAKIIDSFSYNKLLNSNKIYFAGDGAEKCKQSLSQKQNAIFLDDFHPSVSHLCSIADKKFNTDDFENPAYFEPYYLKDFVAGISKVKGLRM